MVGRYYTSGELARRAAVSVRTLRHYDQVGLLPPTEHSDAGYRLYSEADLAALQQILALKLLGFSLGEIGAVRRAESRRLPEILTQQKAMLRERRDHLETIIRAIERTEGLLRTGEPVEDSLIQVMEAIQVEQKNAWADQYFTPEQQAKLDELIRESYSEEARRQLAPRSAAWTAEDQKQADARWAWVNAELKRLIAAGADPTSPEAQAWAKERTDLLSAFSQGNPEIEAGLKRFWRKVWELPEDQRPLNFVPPTTEEAEFTQKAMNALKPG